MDLYRGRAGSDPLWTTDRRPHGTLVVNFDRFTVKHALKMIGFFAALECTKFVFGWSSSPDPARGAYSAPSDLQAGLRGTLLLREREGRKEREGRRGEGREIPKFLDPPLLFADTSDCCNIVTLEVYAKTDANTREYSL